MSKSGKETVEIELSEEDYAFIDKAAKAAGMNIEQFVEVAIYMKIIDDLKRIKAEDIRKIYQMEEDSV